MGPPNKKYVGNKLDTDAERHKEHGSGRGRSKGEADLLANNELMVGAKMRGPRREGRPPLPFRNARSALTALLLPKLIG